MEKGEFFDFRPHGAGKTTTINMLTDCQADIGKDYFRGRRVKTSEDQEFIGIV